MTIAIINGSECYIPFSCLDVNGNAFTPTSIAYQVWDLTNDIEVVPPTTITPAASGTITLDSTVNTMNASSDKLEARMVMVKIGIPGGTEQNLPTRYNLLRKAGTP